MQIPLQISAPNLDLPGPAEEAIRERAAKLDTFSDDIISCRVAISKPHKHQQKGSAFQVKVDLAVPGATIVVTKESYEDIFIAIRDAFHATRRKLEDYVRHRRGAVKYHEEPPKARVSALFPDEGFGFITTPDAREIYFHQNCLVGVDFKDLAIGDLVSFVEEMGEKGPQATTLKKA